MKAISAIYSVVATSPLEDWLLNEPLGETATEGPSQTDIRSSNTLYNTTLLRQGTIESDRPRTSLEENLSGIGTLSGDAAGGAKQGGAFGDGVGHEQNAAGGLLSSPGAQDGSAARCTSLPNREADIEQVLRDALGYSGAFPQYVPVRQVEATAC